MQYFFNTKLQSKKGSILAVAAIMVFLLVLAFMELGRSYYSTVNIIEEQNKKDAHMLSVMGLYVETLDQVSWANKQLKRIAALCVIAIAVPELAPLVQAAQKTGMGLEKYQDLLLLRLKTYAPILDLELRRGNKLSLAPNLHYVEYRRRKGFDFGFFSIPALIEFKNNIFQTACVKHKGIITGSIVCVDHNEYRDTTDSWFAPTEDKWTVRFEGA
jgi:hypothetical protein